MVAVAVAVTAFIREEAEMVGVVRNGMGQQTGQGNKEKGEETGIGITTITRIRM